MEDNEKMSNWIYLVALIMLSIAILIKLYSIFIGMPHLYEPVATPFLVASVFLIAQTSFVYTGDSFVRSLVVNGTPFILLYGFWKKYFYKDNDKKEEE